MNISNKNTIYKHFIVAFVLIVGITHLSFSLAVTEQVGNTAPSDRVVFTDDVVLIGYSNDFKSMIVDDHGIRRLFPLRIVNNYENMLFDPSFDTTDLAQFVWNNWRQLYNHGELIELAQWLDYQIQQQDAHHQVVPVRAGRVYTQDQISRMRNDLEQLEAGL